MFPPGLAPKVNSNPPPPILPPCSHVKKQDAVDDVGSGPSSKDKPCLVESKRNKQEKSSERQVEVAEELSTPEQHTPPLKSSPTVEAISSNIVSEVPNAKDKEEEGDDSRETKAVGEALSSDSTSEVLAVSEKTKLSVKVDEESMSVKDEDVAAAADSPCLTNEASTIESEGECKALPSDKSGEAQDGETEETLSLDDEREQDNNASMVEEEAEVDDKSDIDEDYEDYDESGDDDSVGMPPIIPQVEAAETSTAASKLVSDDSSETPRQNKKDATEGVSERKSERVSKKRKDIHQSEDLNDFSLTGGMQEPPGKKVVRDERESKWMIKYEELRKFKIETGRAYGITKAEQPSLYLWVNDQRKYFKRQENGIASPMTKGRVDLLNQIGFVWDGTKCKRKPESACRDAKWMERYQELKQFKEENGNCRGISQRIQPRLYTWVAEQRKKFMRLNRGDAVTFPRDRLGLLNQLEFEWTPTARKKAKAKCPPPSSQKIRTEGIWQLESPHIQSEQPLLKFATPADIDDVVNDTGTLLSISSLRNLVGSNRVEVQWSHPENGSVGSSCQWWGATVLPYDGRVQEYQLGGQNGEINILPVRIVQYDQRSRRGNSSVDVIFLSDHVLLDLSTQGILCWRDAGDLNNYQLPPSVLSLLTKNMFLHLQAIGFIWVSTHQLKYSRIKSQKRGSVSLSLNSEFVSRSNISVIDDDPPGALKNDDNNSEAREKLNIPHDGGEAKKKKKCAS